MGWIFENTVNHQDLEQQNRQKSASGKKLTPVNVDTKNQCGEFEGSGRNYHVTLEFCECVDFSRRKLPCKHIYRLAHELGVHSLNSVQTGALRKDAPLNIEEIIHKLPEADARLLKYSLYTYVISKTGRDFHAAKGIPLGNLVALGLIIPLPYSAEDAAVHLNVKELKELLEKNGHSWSGTLKRADIVALALQLIPEAMLSARPAEAFQKYELNPAFDGIWNVLYDRFRKLYPEEPSSVFFNPETGAYESCPNQLQTAVIKIKFE